MEFLLSLLLCATHAAQATRCGGDGGSFIMHKIQFPDQLVAGQRSWFTIDGAYPKTIEYGKITATVYKGPFKLMTEVSLLCEKTECPLEGDRVITNFIDIPNNTLATIYKLIVDIEDQDGDRVACFTVPMNIVAQSKLSASKTTRSYGSFGFNKLF